MEFLFFMFFCSVCVSFYCYFSILEDKQYKIIKMQKQILKNQKKNFEMLKELSEYV